MSTDYAKKYEPLQKELQFGGEVPLPVRNAVKLARNALSLSAQLSPVPRPLSNNEAVLHWLWNTVVDLDRRLGVASAAYDQLREINDEVLEEALRIAGPLLEASGETAEE